MFVEFLSNFTPTDAFFLGCVWALVATLVQAVVDYFANRKLDSRIKTLERIIFDKSKVVINIDDFESYCSSKFARPDNLEGYFEFNKDGSIRKVSDIDVKED